MLLVSRFASPRRSSGNRISDHFGLHAYSGSHHRQVDRIWGGFIIIPSAYIGEEGHSTRAYSRHFIGYNIIAIQSNVCFY